MPMVTCGKCQTPSHVALRRGVRLASIACPSCGAHDLHRPNKGQVNPNAGRRYERCARCDRRGLHLTHPAWPWEPKFAVAGPFEAGTPACHVEEPVPATGRIRHHQVDAAVRAVLGDTDRWATDAETAQLETIAGTPLGDCPVCTPAGDGWNAGFYSQATRFATSTALIAVCESCQHTVLRAVRRDRPGTRAEAEAEEVVGRLLAQPAGYGVALAETKINAKGDLGRACRAVPSPRLIAVMGYRPAEIKRTNAPAPGRDFIEPGDSVGVGRAQQQRLTVKIYCRFPAYSGRPRT